MNSNRNPIPESPKLPDRRKGSLSRVSTSSYQMVLNRKPTIRLQARTNPFYETILLHHQQSSEIRAAPINYSPSTPKDNRMARLRTGSLAPVPTTPTTLLGKPPLGYNKLADIGKASDQKSSQGTLSRRRTIGPDSVPNYNVEATQREKRFDIVNRNSNSSHFEGQDSAHIGHGGIEDADFVEFLEDFPSLKSVLRSRHKRIKEKQANNIDLDIVEVDEEQADPLAESRIEKKSKGVECFRKILNFFRSDVEETSEDGESGHDANAGDGSFDEAEIEEMQRLRAKYCRTSLSQFELDDKIRRWSIAIMEWAYFDNIIILLIACNSILLAVLDYRWKDDGMGNKDNDKPITNTIVDESEIFFTLCFTFEASVKILSMGLIMSKGCYLRDGWNCLDFAVVVTGLLQFIPGLANTSALRTFRLFRPLRSLSAIPSMKLLVNTLFNSVRQLSNILVLDNFFILTFAIFGLQMWQGTMHQRCRATEFPVNGTWPLVEDDYRICGSFHQCGVACGSLYETTFTMENGTVQEFEISEDIKKSEELNEPQFNYGITNFDKIGAAYLTIFQVTTLEGWADIMNMIQDGYNVYTGAAFFVICVVTCSYFLLNLTVAVMLDKFKQLNQENTDRALHKYEKNQKRVQELKEMNTIMELRNQVSWRTTLNNFFRNAIYTDPGEPPYEKNKNKADRYRFKICVVCWQICQIPLFNSFILLLIVLNTIILASDQYPDPDVDLIKATNLFFSSLFSAECLIKLVGLRYAEWKAERFNIFDLFIVITSNIELVMGEDSQGTISALRALRLIRLFRLARSNVTLRCLLDSIAHTVKAIGNFMVILMIFIFVFALLGMEMFAGKFVDANGDIPRKNFDNFGESFITVFQILVGDQWNEVMYQAFNNKQESSVVFFVALVLLGKIIMLNLFLSILLGNFEQASLIIRGQMEDNVLKQFELSKKLQEQQERDDDSSNEPPQIQASEETPDEEEDFQIRLTKVQKQAANPFQNFAFSRDKSDTNKETSKTLAHGDVDSESQQEKSFKDSSFDSSLSFRNNRMPIDTPHFTAMQELQLNRTEERAPAADKSSNLLQLPPPMRTKHKEGSTSAKEERQTSIKKFSTFKEHDKNKQLEKKTAPSKRASFNIRSPELMDDDDVQELQRELQKIQRDSNSDMEGQRPYSENPVAENFQTERGLDTNRFFIPKEKDGSSREISNRDPRAAAAREESDDEFNNRQMGSLDDEEPRIPIQTRIYTYMSESSLFVFHKNSCFRKFMLKLTTSSVVKTVTQKDILLSQIQNGGEQDFESDFENNDSVIQQPETTPSVRHSEHFENLAGSNQILPSDQVPRTDMPRRSSTSKTFNPDTSLKLMRGIKLGKNQNMQNMDESDLIALAELQEVADQNETMEKMLKSSIGRRTLLLMKKVKRRCVCCSWSLNQWFETIIYAFILLSMIMLIIDKPHKKLNSDFAWKIQRIDQVITTIFAIEAACRIIALGFFSSSIPHRKAYIKNGSNQIDFFVVIGCDLILVSINEYEYFQTNLDSQTLKSLKVLRTLRALRPLRMISKNQGLKLAVGSLFGALPAIANGMIVCSLFVLIYAIIGINFFKGQFYHCEFPSDFPDIATQLASVTDKESCPTDLGAKWVNEDRNFDTVMNAFSVLYEIITTEGWMDVMYFGLDSNGIDKQPIKNNRPIAAFYFVSFIIIGNIFILKLFVGIVIDKFNRLKDRMQGYALMTRDQKEWIESEKQMIRLELKKKKNPPTGANRLFAYKIQSHKKFEHFIIACIFASTVVMGMQYYGMSTQYKQTLDQISLILTFVYNIEAVIKIIALQGEYFNNSWNRFDFFIVFIADFSLIAEQTLPPKSGWISALAIIKAIRIMRLFRLVRASKDLRVLIDSLIVILPSIGNVGSLIMLMFFIFAVIGMNMFAGVKHQVELNENNNFGSFGMSLLLLIRCSTGENWNIIMRELALSEDDHKHSFKPKCETSQTFEEFEANGPQECGTSLAYLYFGVFIVVFQLMMLNLFVAVVIEGFSSTNKEHTGVVTSEHYNELLSKWEDYDMKATGWIDVRSLIFLIYELNEPLGRNKEFLADIKDQMDDSEEIKDTPISIVDKSKRYVVHMEKNMIVPFKRALHLLNEMDLPVYSDYHGDYKCHFRDVCKRLTKCALEKQIPNYDSNGIEQKHLKILSRAWTEKYSELKTKKLMENYNSGRLWASLFIASCIRNVLNIRKYNTDTKPFRHPKKTKGENGASDDVSGNEKPTIYTPSPTSIRHDGNKADQDDREFAKYLMEILQHQKDEDEFRKLIKSEEYRSKLQIQKKVHDKTNRAGKKLLMSLRFKSMTAQKPVLLDDPRNTKDTQRSTWWVADSRYNYKMKQFVENLEIKEREKAAKEEAEKKREIELQQLTAATQPRVRGSKRYSVEVERSQSLSDIKASRNLKVLVGRNRPHSSKTQTKLEAGNISPAKSELELEKKNASDQINLPLQQIQETGEEEKE